jgi:homoserine dehydrogenase
MPKKKTVNFALLGLGKLGSGFYNIWSQKTDRLGFKPQKNIG